MIYLIAAYIVVWAITFGFVATIFLRQRRLQQQLEWMEELLKTEIKSSERNGLTTSISEVPR